MLTKLLHTLFQTSSTATAPHHTCDQLVDPVLAFLLCLERRFGAAAIPEELLRIVLAYNRSVLLAWGLFVPSEHLRSLSGPKKHFFLRPRNPPPYLSLRLNNESSGWFEVDFPGRIFSAKLGKDVSHDSRAEHPVNNTLREAELTQVPWSRFRLAVGGTWKLVFRIDSIEVTHATARRQRQRIGERLTLHADGSCSIVGIDLAWVVTAAADNNAANADTKPEQQASLDVAGTTTNSDNADNDNGYDATALSQSNPHPQTPSN